MDLKFLFYIFLSVVAITGGAFYLFNNRMEITAGLYFVGILAAAVVFGLRWFSASGEVKLGGLSGSWPPVVNYCPDFLTLYTVNNEQVCIDTIGVAQTGGIAKWDNPNQTDESFLFHLFLNLSGSERLKQLCAQAATKRVTWEGVWDGSVCSGTEPPKPPANAPAAMPPPAITTSSVTVTPAAAITPPPNAMGLTTMESPMITPPPPSV